MNLSDFDYQLPLEYIAQRPQEPRDHSKLMVLNRVDRTIEHFHFYDLLSLLKENDVLVFNTSRVIPARLFGGIEERHELKKAEILLVKRIDEERWEAIGKPGKRFRVGAKIRFKNTRVKGEGFLKATVEGRNDRMLTLKFNRRGKALSEAIHKYGVMPTPPYITEPLAKPSSYQTVYADKEGSIAAPTAGLHFTRELMGALKKRGIKFAFVDLHVGLGTFLPVHTEKIEEHQMHSEYFELSKDTAKRLNKYKAEGRRIVAVGTTSVRVLESCAIQNSKIEPPIGSGAGIQKITDVRVKAKSGETSLFVYPGYQFQFVDAMITNFHLPKSTLLMLVSAFAGREFILEAYKEAVEQKYRFFSFGDAMLIV